MDTNNYPEIDKLKQKQMLKIVSSSFYRELVKYGVDHNDIVSVSTNLLDFVTESKNDKSNRNKKFFELKVGNIIDQWKQNSSITLNEVSIRPLKVENVQTVCDWLNANDIEGTFIDFLPKESAELKQYLLDTANHNYFGTYYNEKFVGIIGAERINQKFKKLEMKKFIGDKAYRGKGIGKLSTFLFLYYTFHILNFNKVFIHSMDTNIKNINLNSHFGFDLEGLLFNEVSDDGGKFHDVIRMGLTQNKWVDLFAHKKENVAV